MSIIPNVVDILSSSLITMILFLPGAQPITDFFIDEADPVALKKEMEERGANLRFGESKGAAGWYCWGAPC